MGTSFSNPIPRTSAPQMHESSRQRSPRDHDAVPRAWQLHRTSSQQAYSNAQNIEQLQRQLNRLRRRSSPAPSTPAGRPFPIIRVLDPLDPTALNYKVGDGILITTGEPVTITDLNVEFTLTTGVEFYWFYLDITDATTAAIDTSALPLAWDSMTIPIGWVDTLVDPPVIHQFVDSNIFCPCVT